MSETSPAVGNKAVLDSSSLLQGALLHNNQGESGAVQGRCSVVCSAARRCSGQGGIFSSQMDDSDYKYKKMEIENIPKRIFFSTFFGKNIDPWHWPSCVSNLTLNLENIF